MSNFHHIVTRTTTFTFPPNELYLYGSRYHCLQTPTSDWDYACSPCPLFKEELAFAGFEEKVLERYKDDLTESVWEGHWEGQKIQVGFKTDMTRFKRVWEAIDFSTYAALFWKQSETRLSPDHIALFINALNRATSSQAILFESLGIGSYAINIRNPDEFRLEVAG